MPDKRKRIAVFVGHADESYQRRFITGLLKSSFRYDMDVCVFSMYRKYQDNPQREAGDSNIFNLMLPSFFDAAVILSDTIQTADALKQIEERLHSDFKGKPVLVIEKDSEYFPGIFTDGYVGVAELVAHLIEVHGMRDIAFLSGKRWHKHSQQRLRAYIDTMESHGLKVSENRIFYGDFWYMSGEECAEHLISDPKGLPEAVVCANDAMTIGLCKALAARGVDIPGQVAVVSYDSTIEGQTSPVPITSALIPAEEFGEYAGEWIKARMDGTEPPEFNVKPHLMIGKSCGCDGRDMPEICALRDTWETVISEEGFDSVNNMMAENLLSQTDLESFLGVIYSYAYQIKGAESFHLCLCKPWKHMGADADHNVGNIGYTDKMIYAVKYNRDRKDGYAGLDNIFMTSELLPGLEDSRENPAVYFFLPVFFDSSNYGYAAVCYGNTARTYDDIYRRWIELVSRSLESLRRELVIHGIAEKLDKLKKSKFATEGAVFDSLSEEEKSDYKLVGRILDENLLTYHFQPIVDTIDGSIFSYEALMRPKTDKFISPLMIIKYADMQNRLTDVERATFMNVLGIVENENDSIGEAKVFINSIPGVRISDNDLEMVEESLKRHSDTVVVELTEEAELDDSQLGKLKDKLRRMNIEIAVDDYGTGYSNVTNLLRYMPNYVKIDRSLLSEIQNKPQKQHFVREVISFCRENNIMALAEGIETTEELRTVIQLGANLIQGYYTARPAPTFIGKIDEKVREEIRMYHREFAESELKQRYIAGKTNRVSLPALIRDGCNEIVVGKGTMVYKDITIIGAPGTKTDVHVRVEQGYSGRITLENVYLSNTKERPCIELADNCDLTLVIAGDNVLKGCGILVPKHSKLTLEGDGNINIIMNTSEYFGIGAPVSWEHGTLLFRQSGIVEILGRGAFGSCIGSGLGGQIHICGGQYSIESDCTSGVGIGSLSGNTEIEIKTCNISLEFACASGVGIGSVEGDCRISTRNCSVSAYGDGSTNVGIGSVSGEVVEALIEDSNISVNMNADDLTGIGSLKGRTLIKVSRALVKIDCSGDRAVSVGGMSGNAQITLKESDIRWKVRNKLEKDLFARDEDIIIEYAGGAFIHNGVEIDRNLK